MRRVVLALAALLAAQSVHAQGAEWPDRDRREGLHLRILGDYELAAGATASEPIVVIGGSAVVNGHAADDVLVLGGTLRVGPTAVIDGDVSTIGGEAIIDPAARIAGRVDHTAIVGPDFDIALPNVGRLWWAAFAFGATLLRLGVILVIALLLTVVAPDWVRTIARRIRSAPVAVAGIGVATQVLFVPAMVAIVAALVISIVGVVLLLAFPFVLGAAALVWVAGFTAVAMNIGARLRGGGGSAGGAADVAIGFVLIAALTLTAQALSLSAGWVGPVGWFARAAGWVVEWIAWTVGLGGAVAVLFGGRQAVTPPPIPLVTPAPRPTT